MNKKRTLAIFALLVLFAIALSAGASTATSAEQELTFSISDRNTSPTRAYAYKISVTKEVIEAAGKSPCNAQTDPYGCDKNRYNQQPNCPPEKKTFINPAPPVGVAPGDIKTGGAGGKVGEGPGVGKEPEGASPVKINELLTVGQSISHSGPTMGAAGAASDGFVDVSGRANPEAHAESDAFVSNKEPYEERCDPATGSSYLHVISRSNSKPENYNLVECYGDKCSQTKTGTQGRPSAQRAFSIVHVYQDGQKVYGKLKAFVSNMSQGSGAQSLGVESMTTFLSFESDGTKNGLKWTAISSASGVTIGGQSVALHPGDTIGTEPLPCVPSVGCPGSVFIGVAGPYVVASADGTQLTMVAPGLFYATSQQTTYVAGAEVRAKFGRAVPFSFSALGLGSSSSLGLLRPGPSPFGSEETLPTDLGATGPTTIPGEPPVLSVKKLSTAPWGFGALAVFGAAVLAVVLAGWIQRYGWARKLFRLQPFRSFNWMYRAFVRT